MAQAIYTIACAWAWIGFVTVVLAFHTHLGGDIAYFEIMWGWRSWRGFVASGVAVLQGVALTCGRQMACAGRAVAYVTLLALVGRIHAFAVPILFMYVLTTRANGAVVEYLGKRKCLSKYTKNKPQSQFCKNTRIAPPQNRLIKQHIPSHISGKFYRRFRRTPATECVCCMGHNTNTQRT